MKSLFTIILFLIPVVIFIFKDNSNEISESNIRNQSEESSDMKYPNDNEYIKRTFPFYRADPDAHLIALEKGRQMRQASELDNSVPSWDFAGPVNIGGRTSDLEYDPNNPNLVYAGAATGGVFKSTDGGISFFSVFDDLAVLPIGDIEVDPVNSINIFILVFHVPKLLPFYYQFYKARIH